MSTKPLQAQSFTLSGGGVTIGATSIKLTSFKTIDGANITMSDLGTRAFLTIEPNNSISEEQIFITGVTQNGDDSADLTGVSSVLFTSPFTATSGLTKAHQGGASVVLSNTSAFEALAAFKDNDETITGIWTYSTLPQGTTDPVAGNDLARRSWVLSVVSGGTVSGDSITVPATAGETIATGEWVYLNTDGKWYRTSAALSASCENVIIGTAQGAGTNNNPITGGVVVDGQDENTQTGLVAGTTYYLTNTPGQISTTPGTISKVAGVAITTTAIIVDDSVSYIPTAGQKAALAGSSGTPSASNKYVLENDTTVMAYVAAEKTTTQSFNPVTSTPITAWTTEHFDSTNSFNPTTGVFTAPRAADYMVSFSGTFNTTAWTFNSSLNLLLVSSSPTYTNNFITTTSAQDSTAISMSGINAAVIRLNAGATLTFNINQTSAIAKTLGYAILSIRELPSSLYI